MPVQNLWPDFDLQTAPRSPKRVLQEAGLGLSEKTHGLIEFAVQTHADESQLIHDCYLWVRNLNFRYPFLTVTHGGTQTYPVEITSDTFGRSRKADNEDRLLEILEEIFRSPQTINAVTQLIDAAS